MRKIMKIFSMALVVVFFHAGIVLAQPGWTVREDITNAGLNSIWGNAEDDIFAVGSGFQALAVLGFVFREIIHSR